MSDKETEKQPNKRDKKNSVTPLRCLTSLFILLSLAIILINNGVNASISEKSTKTPQAQSTTQPQEQTLASLSGFEPEALVSYTIYNPNGSAFIGKAQTDSFGNLTLPMPEEFESNSGDLTYNFLIDENEQTLSVVLMHNTKTGELSVEGSGTKEFTKIVIETEEDSTEIHSDWAGLFKKKNINNIWSQQDNEAYKIAFFSTDPARSINELTRAPVIQINSAPGGGGPGNGQVNQIQTSNCGDPPISFCQNSMTRQIQNVVDNFIEPMQFLGEQFTYNAMRQAYIIGTFFDAKEQLETQRDIQALRAEAIRDYNPSEQLCEFGSFTKSLATTEQKMRADKLAFNTIMTDFYTNKQNTSSKYGDISASKSRLQQFREVYCNPTNNSGGLDYLCEHDQNNNTSDSTYRSNAPAGIGGTDTQRMNKDIDYLRTFDTHYTLDIDFTDAANTEDEEDILALAKNLYWPKPYQINPDPASLASNKYQYMTARRILAVNNLAHNSFAHQIAMKSRSPGGNAAAGGGAAGGGAGGGAAGGAGGGAAPVIPGWAHLKTMMREFGLSDEDIVAMIGENPSYFAQMDILGKKIYQTPNFYTNLYDTTANIDRINVTLDAIALMQQRDHYETMLRQEMLASGLIQTDLTPTIERLQVLLGKSKKK